MPIEIIIDSTVSPASVTGKGTFSQKEHIKECGGRWSNEKKVWEMPHKNIEEFKCRLPSDCNLKEVKSSSSSLSSSSSSSLSSSSSSSSSSSCTTDIKPKTPSACAPEVKVKLLITTPQVQKATTSTTSTTSHLSSSHLSSSHPSSSHPSSSHPCGCSRSEYLGLIEKTKIENSIINDRLVRLEEALSRLTKLNLTYEAELDKPKKVTSTKLLTKPQGITTTGSVTTGSVTTGSVTGSTTPPVPTVPKTPSVKVLAKSTISTSIEEEEIDPSSMRLLRKKK